MGFRCVTSTTEDEFDHYVVQDFTLLERAKAKSGVPFHSCHKFYKYPLQNNLKQPCVFGKTRTIYIRLLGHYERNADDIRYISRLSFIMSLSGWKSYTKRERRRAPKNFKRKKLMKKIIGGINE